MKPKNNNYKWDEEDSNKEDLRYIAKLLQALTVSLLILFVISILFTLFSKP